MAINCFGFELCRPQDCFQCKQSTHFRTKMWTEEWLRRYLKNPQSMTSLRGLAAESGHGRLTRLSDEGVIRVVAGEICFGRLQVCDNAAAWPEDGDSSTAGGKTAGNSMAAPFPLSQRQARSASTGQPDKVDQPTLSSDLDQNAQAASMTTASKTGTPFCAECEKRKQEMAAAAAGGKQ